MCIEMNHEEMTQYYVDHPNILPIHIGNAMFGWRSFLMDDPEIARFHMVGNSIAADGSENYKHFNYISRVTGIPVTTMETFTLWNDGVLTVVPIVISQEAK